MSNFFERGLTRRSLLEQASSAGLIGFSSGLIMMGDSSPALAAPPPFEAYHGVTAAVHQANFNRLVARRFRPISISVYGNPPNVLYAAVWVSRTGPAFAAVHGLNARDYQAAFDTWSGKGFAPTVVSATGNANSPVFAAVFEQGVPGTWKSRHGMTDADFANENNAARSAQQILRWVSIYGAPGDRRYIAAWHGNPAYAKWNPIEHSPSNQYQGQFESHTQVPRFRPACVSLASDQTVSAIFTDEGIGPWTARHGLTSTAYQTEFNTQRQAGNMPICVQGGGSGGSLRYAAIFASQDQPSPRRWTVVGTQDAKMVRFDGMMRAFMARHGVRAAQLTIAQNGVNQLQRAYTWAEPDYRTTQIADIFLLASNSKLFVTACCQRLYDTGKLQTTSQPYQLLGFSKPKDKRSDSITVQQLLDHTAGFTEDPTYDMRNIALTRNLPAPAGKRDVASYMYGRDLGYTPGAPTAKEGFVYNNYGYLLASLVVEQVSGQDYVQFLRSQVLQPDGITQVAAYPTAPQGRPANMIPAEDDGLGLSALFIRNRALVPNVFGGDGMFKESCVGSCGMAASATALVQFIRRHAAWGTGGRMVSARMGSTPGSSTWAQSLNSGTDWSLVMNTRNFVPPWDGKHFEGFVDTINAEIARVGL